jgi:phosphatidylglycerol---prolipoprotein diacylglyceryl transferase
MAGCTDSKFCNELPVGVYPTPFYEIVACFILFLVIWSLRKKFKIPGTLFGLYLMLNGMERFFIEKIRVNTRLNIFGLQPTQAEVISALLFLSGLVIWIVLARKAKRVPASGTVN